MRSHVLGIFLLASCWTPVAGGTADRGSAKRSQSTTTGVGLSLKAQGSDDGIDITFSVRNVTKDKLLWMNTNPHIGHHRDRAKVSEIEISMMDKNRREVSSTCTSLRVPIKSSDFIVLKPGASFDVKYTISSNCYLLDAGETILIHAGFAHIGHRPPCPPGVWEYVGRANADDWMPIEVPRAWAPN